MPHITRGKLRNKGDMIGLKRGLVKLVPYSRGWKRSFANEQRKLKKVMGKDALVIEHIGSTALPGMSAKPIIDIALIVPSFSVLNKYKDKLKKIGYVQKEDDNRPDRLFFPKGSINRRTHYLHIGEKSQAYVEDMIIFRDYLLGHSDVMKEYAMLKKELAEKYKDHRRHYTAAKEKFVQEVLERVKVLP